MPSPRQRLGDFGERVAAAHLEAKGYRIVGRKFRVRDCEIDLIAVDGDQLVFVEARTRRGAYPGMAALSVTRRKAAKLLFALDRYVEAHPEAADMPLRVDVVAVELDAAGKMRDVIHIEDAVRG
ncbi:MAG TPA: YraN family protein [Dehalococcoidia bacterium]|jgi:putative endonuclease|nr:YraN family protein [Dehalococcoidia bacterium]